MLRVLDPKERIMNRLDQAIVALTSEFPTWTFRYDATADAFRGQHPAFAENGIELQARLPADLAQRVRHFVACYVFRLTAG